MSKSCTYPLTTQNFWGFVFSFCNTLPKSYVLLNECFSLLYYWLLVSWRHDVKEINQSEIEKRHAPLKEDKI